MWENKFRAVFVSVEKVFGMTTFLWETQTEENGRPGVFRVPEVPQLTPRYLIAVPPTDAPDCL